MKTLLFLLLAIPSLYAQTFTYETTQEKSISKFHRLAHIEKFLAGLDGKIKDLKGKLEKSDNKIKGELDKEMTKIRDEISGLKKEVQKIKEEASKSKKGQEGDKLAVLEKTVQAQQEEIINLKNQFESLNGVLKSLNILMGQQKELENRGKKPKP